MHSLDTMGSVVLSLDAELAWGFRDSETIPESRVATARKSWLRLLELFDDFDVPATWSVVGHLFLDSCDGVHADHSTPDYVEDGTSGDWFDRDPGTWEGRDGGWYGSNLIDGIERADADHEVGCHTFSHVEMDRVSREVASAEVRTCVELAERRGLAVDSFTFPGNAVAHRDVLAAYGVKSYRGVRPRRWYERGVVATVADLVGWPVVSPTVVTPEEDEYGLVNLPASLSLFECDGRARSAAGHVTEDPVVKTARRGIDRAATEDGVFHAWFRVNDLTDDRDFDRVTAVLEHVEEVREGTALTVETMGSVAAEVKDDEPLPREPIGPR